MQNLQVGDLLFRYTQNSALEEQISLCGLNYSNQKLNHVGIFCPDNLVIEASQDGVVLTPLVDFWQGDMFCKRLDLSELELVNVLEKAKSYLHTKYNFAYTDSAETIYCSELVIRAFDVLPHSPFARHPITFKNPFSGKIDDFWLNLYGNTPIPEGDWGSHPASLYEKCK